MAGTWCSLACSTALQPSLLSLQLLLELLWEPPVGALGDELLRTALEHTSLVQAEGVKAHRILGVVLAPLVVWNIFHGLEGIVVPGRVALIHKDPGRPLRLTRAHVGCFQDRAQRPFGGHRVCPDECPVPGHHVAEVVGPGLVERTVYNHVPEPLLP